MIKIGQKYLYKSEVVVVLAQYECIFECNGCENIHYDTDIFHWVCPHSLKPLRSLKLKRILKN